MCLNVRFMWLGLSQEVGELKQGLPDGYNIERDRFCLPKGIRYIGTPMPVLTWLTISECTVLDRDAAFNPRIYANVK